MLLRASFGRVGLVFRHTNINPNLGQHMQARTAEYVASFYTPSDVCVRVPTRSECQPEPICEVRAIDPLLYNTIVVFTRFQLRASDSLLFHLCACDRVCGGGVVRKHVNARCAFMRCVLDE